MSTVDYDYTRGPQILAEDHYVYEDRDGYDERHPAEERHWGDFPQPLAGSMGLSGQPNRYLEEARYLAGVRASEAGATCSACKRAGHSCSRITLSQRLTPSIWSCPRRSVFTTRAGRQGR